MKREHLLLFAVFVGIVLFFFFPLFQGQVPFPGDLLVGHYEPYKTNSYSGYGPGGVPHKAQGPDVITQLYPWKYFVIESYKAGSLPFWNPFQFSGTPQLSDFQSGAFYPLNLIFLLSGFVTGWIIFIFLIPLLSILFVYLYLREMGLSRLSCVFSGVVFAFSSYMVVWMEYGNIGHTLVWLPFILFTLEKLMKRYSVKWAISFVAAFVMAFLAGYIQGYFYLTMAIILYYFVKRIGSKTFSIKGSLYFLTLLIFPIGLTVFQLLPTLQLFSHSSRGNYSLDQIRYLLNPVWYCLTVLVPDFFGHPASRNQWIPITYIERVSYFGFLPFLLAIFGLISHWKNRIIKLFTFILIFTFLISLDLFFTKFIYLLPIPVISTTVPTRILSLFVFSGSILSGYGMEQLIKREQKRTFFIISLSALFFIIMLWGIVMIIPRLQADTSWITNMAIAKRNLYLPTCYAVISILVSLLFVSKYWKTITSRIMLLLVVVITLFDLFYFFHKITPFSPREYIFPNTPVMQYLQKNAGINRFWGYGSAAVTSNFSTAEGVYSVEGVDALHIEKYTQLLESTNTGTPPKLVSRSDANLAPGYGTGDLSANTYRKKLMNLLGVKYILNKNENLTGKNEPDIATFHQNEYNLVWQNGPWQAYENISVAPRFFLTDKYLVEDDRNFFKTFYANSFNEKTTIVLSEDPNLKKSKLTQKNAALISYTPTKVSIKSNTNSEALLFLSDTMYPGWRVSIDGIDKKIYQADYVFRSVVVPQGEHIVTFYYENLLFRIGLIMSFLCTFCLGLVLWKIKVKAL